MNLKSVLINLTKKTYLPFLIIIFLTTVLFLTVLPLGHDISFHMYRIGAMAKELKLHPFCLPIRMLSDSYNGYGYGAALYYGDLFLYLPAALTAFFNLKVAYSYRILVIFIFWVTLAFSYFAYYRVSSCKKSSFCFAIIYSYSAYFLADMAQRSAIGECSAMAFIPLVYISFYEMVELNKNDAWLYLSLGMSGIILSHNLTAFMVLIALVIWLVFSLKKINVFVVKTLAKAVILTAGICASYIFPLLEQMAFQKTRTPTNNDYQMEFFLYHVLDAADFFMPFELKKIFAVLFSLPLDEGYWHPGAVGLLLSMSVVIFIKYKKIISGKLITTLLMLSVILTAILFCRPAIALMRHFLSFIQFPWRLLIFPSFFTALFLAISLEKIKNEKVFFCVMMSACFIGLYCVGLRYLYQVYLNYKGMEFIEETKPESADKYRFEYDRNAADILYLPTECTEGFHYARGETVTSNHEDVLIAFERENDKIILTVNNNNHSDLTAELPLIMYKGYSAVRLSDGVRLNVSKSDNGFVEVSIPISEDEQIITVAYTGTVVQKISDAVSFVSLITLCFVTGGKTMSKFGTKNKDSKEAAQKKNEAAAGGACEKE